MAHEARARRDLETDLRKALALGELSLLYQPCGNVPSHELTGFEARPRWDHPTRGVVPDRDLVPLAEAAGCTVALREWVLKTACADAVGWPAPLTVRVRIPSRQLQQADRITATVKRGLEETGLPPGRLELKVSETALQAAEAEVLPTLHRLRALGVGISLVDFVIGPSLLDRLRSFPFHSIAFDAGNLFNVAADTKQASILHALSAAGFNNIGCYFGDLQIPASGIPEVVRLHASTGNLSSAAE
jgi:EAL domain-containing protein (putative c-di-GMP-specific phosphodiesterase class I)